MGAGTALRLLTLDPTQVKSAVLAGVGDYVIEETVREFPKNWPVPDSVPRPITAKVWLEEGAKILEKGELVPGHLASASLIAAQVTGADPKVLAAVLRGHLGLEAVDIIGFSMGAGTALRLLTLDPMSGKTTLAPAASRARATPGLPSSGGSGSGSAPPNSCGTSPAVFRGSGGFARTLRIDRGHRQTLHAGG